MFYDFRENIRKEIRELKKDFQQNKKQRVEETKQVTIEKETRSETLQDYDDSITKYAEKKKTLPKKGTSREQFTLELLKKFKQKLDTAKEAAAERGDVIEAPIIDDDDNEKDDKW